MNIIEKYNDFKLRMSFSSAARVEFYETLSLLLTNGAMLKGALGEMYNVYSNDDKNPNAPLAVICRTLLAGINSGKKLSLCLAQFVDHTESSLIAGGESSGDMKRSFDYAVKVIQKKGEIKSAVALATVYPAFLLLMTSYLLNLVSADLVPKFAKMSNPSTWTGAAYTLYIMGGFVTSYGKLTLLFVILLAAGIFVTMPHLRGDIRVKLDRYLPWSMYRMLHGSTFLLNVAVMVGSGVQLQLALERLAADASPWLKERIEAARYGTQLGSNLGVALKDSGYEFPDSRAVRYLQLIASQDGFENAVTNFAERWMDQTASNARATGKAVLSVGIVLIGALMMLIMTGTNDIASTVQNASR